MAAYKFYAATVPGDRDCTKKGGAAHASLCHRCGKVWAYHNDHHCQDGGDGWFDDETDPNAPLKVAETSPVSAYNPVTGILGYTYSRYTGYTPPTGAICHGCKSVWDRHNGYRCHNGRHGYFGPQPDPCGTSPVTTIPEGATLTEAQGGATTMLFNVIATRKVTKVDSTTHEQTVVERVVVSIDNVVAPSQAVALLIAGRQIDPALSDEDLSVGVIVSANQKA